MLLSLDSHISLDSFGGVLIKRFCSICIVSKGMDNSAAVWYTDMH